MSKIINLLHFVHDNMPHDGNHRAFAEMDAIDLYNYVKKSTSVVYLFPFFFIRRMRSMYVTYTQK